MELNLCSFLRNIVAHSELFGGHNKKKSKAELVDVTEKPSVVLSPPGRTWGLGRKRGSQGGRRRSKSVIPKIMLFKVSDNKW